MADQKISQLNALTGAEVDDATDVLAIVDASNSETKKISRGELFQSVSEITGTAITQSWLDATSGRLTQVGDYGWGATGDARRLAGDLNDITVTGLYRYDLSNLNYPSDFGMLLHINRRAASAAGGISQIAYSHTGDTYVRYSTGASGSAWSDWVKQNPTQGSNANGTYVRFSDGTQICTINAFTTSAAGELTWTYPAAFSYPASPDRPSVSGTIVTSVANPAFLHVGSYVNSGGTNTGVTVAACRHDGTLISADASITAIGRWF